LAALEAAFRQVVAPVSQYRMDINVIVKKNSMSLSRTYAVSEAGALPDNEGTNREEKEVSIQKMIDASYHPEP